MNPIIEAVENEKAWLKLRAVTRPGALTRVVLEVLRRRRDLGMTEREAVASVTDDLVVGRWDPRL